MSGNTRRASNWIRLTRFFRFLSSGRLLFYFYKMSHDGYLSESGWIRSFVEKRPVDRDGQPVPWVTHAFTAFITPRLQPEFKLLEFGAGASTLFYSNRLNSITSIESDRDWFQRIKDQIDATKVNLMLKDGAAYWECLSEFHDFYDIVIIDGHDRLECARSALNHLSPSGVIVLDNSNRPTYGAIYSLLDEAGFRWIDFFGLAPAHRRSNCTTVFYRTGNCLKI